MKNAKKWTLSILTASCLLCAGFAVNSISASAEEVATPTPTIVMTRGASVRLTEGSTGLKFAATIEGYTEECTNTYGAFIVPYDYFSKAGATISDTTDYVKVFTDAFDAEKIANAPIVAEGLKPKKSERGKFFIEYSITNLYEHNYHRTFFGIIFEKTGENTYSYPTSDDNARSIMEVASGALTDFYYNTTELQTKDEALYNQYKANENLLNKFVTVGIANNKNITEEKPFAYKIVGNEEESLLDSGKSIDLALELPEHLRLLPNWTSSDPEVATVDHTGKVTGHFRGTATITASSQFGGQEFSSTKVINVQSVTQTETIVFSEFLTNRKTLGNPTIGDITLWGAKAEGSSTSAPTYYDNGAALRLYPENILSLKLKEGYKIQKVEMVAEEDLGYDAYTSSWALKAQVDDTKMTWTPHEDTIIDTLIFSNSEQCRIQSMTVEYIQLEEGEVITGGEEVNSLIDAPKIEKEKENLDIVSSVMDVSLPIELPTQGTIHKDVSISWTVVEGVAIAQLDGATLTLTKPTVDTIIKLKATFATTEKVTGTKEVTITVLADEAITVTQNLTTKLDTVLPSGNWGTAPLNDLTATYVTQFRNRTTAGDNPWTSTVTKLDDIKDLVGSTETYRAPTLRGETGNSSVLTSAELQTGISAISFNCAYLNSEKKDLELKVQIVSVEQGNLVLAETLLVINLTSVKQDTAMLYIAELSRPITEKFRIIITNVTEASNSNPGRVTIWNLQWLTVSNTEPTA